jgi:anthranilate phosphoribosyltransferase
MNAADFGLPASIRRAHTGESLTSDEAEGAIGAFVSGTASQDEMAALLTAIAKRGPTWKEIVGGARALRANMMTVAAPDGAIDVCGTGGDGQGTLNVSTAVGFVVAACGVPVAKHGNRAMSSRSGSADVLEALGVRVDGAPDISERCLREAGICFMFAQTHHPAMKQVAAVRKALGFRTIFNLLGPLSNPAQVRRQLVGVYGAEFIEPVARALRELGAISAWVVHSADGLDELSIAAPTKVAQLKDGEITMFEVSARQAGVALSPLVALKGGDAPENAAAIRSLLAGERNAFRDIVLLNAAAALIVAGKVADLRDGALRAAEAVDTGAAKTVLDRFVAASRA